MSSEKKLYGFYCEECFRKEGGSIYNTPLEITTVLVTHVTNSPTDSGTSYTNIIPMGEVTTFVRKEDPSVKTTLSVLLLTDIFDRIFIKY